MRKLGVLAVLLAAGCNPEVAPPANGSGNRVVTVGAPRAPAQTATLTGLYESGGAPPSQLCITEQGRAARFGLVTRRGGQPGCSGAGTATRNGATLRLAMNGESACTIEAHIEGLRVTFPATLPRGCAYYCRQGAAAGGIVFVKTGGGRGDAQRARDLVGDPLCT